MPKKLLPFAAILTIAACTTGEIQRNVFSHPNWVPQNQKQEIKRIIIASTHGFQVKPEAIDESVPLKGQLSDHRIQVGGIKALSSYLSILKKRYKDNLLLLDTGPFLKNIEAMQDLNSLVDFYTKMNYDGVAFTEREIQGFLDREDLIEGREIPFVNSNILDIKTNQTVQRNSIIPARVVEVNGVKVGIISASLLKKDQSPLNGLYFEDPVLSFLKHKNKLQKRGAQIVLLLANLKSNCRTEKPKDSASFRQANLDCAHEESNDNLVRLLKRLPLGSIDAVIGYGKDFANGFIGSTPILQIPAGQPYLGRMELHYDVKNKRLLPNRSYVYAPTKLCHNFFLATNDCHIEGDTDRLKSIQKTNFQLIPAKFLGMEVKSEGELHAQNEPASQAN